MTELYDMISVVPGHVQPSTTMKSYMFSEAFHTVIDSEYVRHDGRCKQHTYKEIAIKEGFYCIICNITCRTY